MNKNSAKRIARENEISYGEIKEILTKARASDINWEAVSSVNKGITKGVAFNIFWKGITDEDHVVPYSTLYAQNVLREFGEFSQYADYNNPKKQRNATTKVVHQEPMEI